MAATDHYRDDEDILKELEDAEDDELFRIRENRMRQLQKELTQMQEMRENNHGIYEKITEEKEILRLTTNVKRCVIHFYHKDFRRCQIMDEHLEKLSQKHFKTKFAKIDVENAPFLVTKLNIQVLPCVVAFIDGITADKLIGFERLGGNDDFKTPQLEKLLVDSGVFVLSPEENPQGRSTIFGFKQDGDSDSD